METSRPVVVKRVPECLTRKEARAFLDEVRPLLKHDRPQLVFDLSLVREMDSAGVDILLHCLKEAMRLDGDLKPASLSPKAQVMLDLTRAGRLFETFPASLDALHSFSAYFPNTVRQNPPPEPALQEIPDFQEAR